MQTVGVLLPILPEQRVRDGKQHEEPEVLSEQQMPWWFKLAAMKFFFRL